MNLPPPLSPEDFLARLRGVPLTPSVVALVTRVAPQLLGDYRRAAR